jgi:hypothetical protein
MGDIREKLKRANKVTEDKKPNDKQRIAELEAENKDLMDAVIELAEIVGGAE